MAIKIDKVRMRELLTLGLTSLQISREFKCSAETIRRYINWEGLPSPRETISSYRAAVAKRLKRLGFSPKQIMYYFDYGCTRFLYECLAQTETATLQDCIWETIEIKTHHPNLPAGTYHLSHLGLVSKADGTVYDDLRDLGEHSSLIGTLCFASALRKV